MPELPEVETTRRGIEPHVLDQTVRSIVVRHPVLRWPIPPQLSAELPGRTIESVSRRGKYLILGAGDHYLLVHLGMSGSLRLVESAAPVGRHDHVDILLSSGLSLRYTDPRRFGAFLWGVGDPEQHPLLASLGPEPLRAEFTDAWLHEQSRRKKQAVKTFIMDSHVVVGVGNIYANEALFMAGIDPRRAAGRISAARYRQLTQAIREVLQQAIGMGGTTLRDFVGGTGKPGYFRQSLRVYGRGDEPCLRCSTTLKEIRLGQRSTVFCPRCQT